MLHLNRIALLSAAVVAFAASAAQAQEIYVPNKLNGTVSVINVATNTVETISIPGTPCNPEAPAGTICPEGVAISGGFAFVSLDASDQVIVIDTTTHSIVNSITTRPRFDPVVFLGPNNNIYVTGYSPACDTGDYDFRHIAVVNATLQTHVSADDIDSLPLAGVGNMAFFGNHGYALGCGWNTLARVDLTTHDLTVMPLGVGSNADVAVHPLGGVALVTSGDCLRVVDLAASTPEGMEEIATLCDYSFLTGVQFNASGDRAYALDSGMNALIELDTTTPSAPVVLSTTPIVTGRFVYDLQLANGTAFIVASHDFATSEIIEVELGGSAPVQGCSASVGHGAIALALDGALSWDCPNPGPHTRGKAHGAGRLETDDKITFAFDVKSTKHGPKGTCDVTNHTVEPKERVRCLDVTDLYVHGDEAIIRGTACHNGKGQACTGGVLSAYEIYVADRGKGRHAGNDTFFMFTESGFQAGPATVRSGDVKVTEAKKKPRGDDDDD